MITNDLIHEFTALVDEIYPHVPADADIWTMMEFSGLPPSSEQRLYPSMEPLFVLIRETITASSADLSNINLHDLRRALLRHSVFNGSAAIYRAVPEAILYGVNEQAFKPLAFRDSWLQAVRAAFAIMAFPIYHGSKDLGLERDVAVAQAAVRLRNFGYQLRLEGKNFLFEEGELDRCCISLDKKVATIGGAELLATLLRYLLRPRFRNGRYSLPREAQPVTTVGKEPAIPFGYLINLAVKHISQPDRFLLDKPLFESIIQRAKDIVALLDLEAYTAFQILFTSHSNLPDYIQDIVLGDFCLSFQQQTVPHALYMLERLFCWVNLREMDTKLGWNVQDALSLARAALTSTIPEEVNVVLTRDYLTTKSGCSRKVLDRMLPYFTHDNRTVNHRFLRPFDATVADFPQKPFIWKSGNHRLLVSPVMGTIGFYEALTTALRAHWPDVDTQVGAATEALLAEAFRTHGIQPSAVSKKYKVGAHTYECDLILAHPDAILLFEIKKKPITQLARSGNVLVTIRDIALAMIQAQLQLSRHEHHLLSKDKITFFDGTEIHHEGRRIERIAVTLFDWGGLQDRLISDNIMKILATAKIGATQPAAENAKIVADINTAIIKYQAQLQALNKVKPDSPEPFFDCLFLSVPLILYLLDGTQSLDDFYYKLKTQKGIVSGAADPYSTDARFRQQPS